MTREDEIALKAARASTLKSLKIKKKLRIQQIEEEAAEKIREIQIQYAEDPERLKAKYAAADYAKSEKARRRAERAIAREKAHIERQNKFRPFSLGEEICSSIIQGMGAGLSIAATALLDVVALNRIPPERRTVYFALFTVLGATMTVNYLMSLLYHAIPAWGAKEVFKRICRAGAFAVIACVYALYAYNIFPLAPAYVAAVTGAVWLICLTGLIMYAIAGSRLEIVNRILFAALIGAGLFICRQLRQTLSAPSFGMLAAAAVCFTCALIFQKLRKIKYFHAIGNLILLIGSVYFFFSLLETSKNFSF